MNRALNYLLLREITHTSQTKPKSDDTETSSTVQTSSQPLSTLQVPASQQIILDPDYPDFFLGYDAEDVDRASAKLRMFYHIEDVNSEDDWKSE